MRIKHDNNRLLSIQLDYCLFMYSQHVKCSGSFTGLKHISETKLDMQHSESAKNLKRGSTIYPFSLKKSLLVFLEINRNLKMTRNTLTVGKNFGCAVPRINQICWYLRINCCK